MILNNTTKRTAVAGLAPVLGALLADASNADLPLIGEVDIATLPTNWILILGFGLLFLGIHRLRAGVEKGPTPPKA